MPIFSSWNGCSCVGHKLPYIEHFEACCDAPHMTEEEWEAQEQRIKDRLSLKLPD